MTRDDIVKHHNGKVDMNLENRVVNLALQGISAKHIATRLGLKRGTVRTVLQGVRERIGLDSDVPDPPHHDPMPTQQACGLMAGSQQMLLPLSRTEHVVHTVIEQLTLRVQERYEKFEIQLSGPGNVLPDTALAICNLLRQRPEGVILDVSANSSLINADLLVYLAGDRRQLRPDAWVYFESPQLHEGGRYAKPGSSGLRYSGYQTDYREVFERIVEFLPPEFADRRIHSSELSEWLD